MRPSSRRGARSRLDPSTLHHDPSNFTMHPTPSPNTLNQPTRPPNNHPPPLNLNPTPKQARVTDELTRAVATAQGERAALVELERAHRNGLDAVVKTLQGEAAEVKEMLARASGELEGKLERAMAVCFPPPSTLDPEAPAALSPEPPPGGARARRPGAARGGVGAGARRGRRGPRGTPLPPLTISTLTLSISHSQTLSPSLSVSLSLCLSLAASQRYTLHQALALRETLRSQANPTP